jgi:hypothetical protein
MYLPSTDQSLGSRMRGVSSVRSCSAGPGTPIDCRYNPSRPPRSELNTIAVPSGDQIGSASTAGSDVIRVGTFRSTSTIQMSQFPVCGSIRLTATSPPSGEIAGLRYSTPSSGCGIERCARPEPSNHVN